jgi:hypothetical protein
MLTPLRLDLLMKQGYVRNLVLNAANTQETPPKGHMWLVLNGQVNHVTGTASTLSIQKPLTVHIITSIMEIPAAIGTFVCPLWSIAAQTGGFQSAFAPTIIEDDEILYFAAAATAEAHIKVIEWKVS